MSNGQLGRVFVTGADGFIGSHLVEVLVSLGVEVTALCIYNSNGQHGWLESSESQKARNLSVVLGDVRDPFQMDSLIKGHDTVFHLASLIAIPYSYAAPQAYIETNVTGALNIAQACLRHGVRRLIHTSTSEVYGTAQFVPITEAHPLQGQSPYSASKIGADMVMESFHRSFDLGVVTVRPFNTYGPRQSYRAVIPTIIGQVLAGVRTLNLGSLTPTRDFNFVQDTVNGFLMAASADASRVVGQVFNVGSGREISIGDIVGLIAALCNTQVQVTANDERVRPAKSEVERLLADASKFHGATGWKPAISLEEGLSRTIAWQKSLPSTFKAVNYQT